MTSSLSRPLSSADYPYGKPAKEREDMQMKNKKHFCGLVPVR